MSELMEKAAAAFQAEKEYCYFEGVTVGEARGEARGIATGIADTIALMKKLIREGISPEEAIARLEPKGSVLL